jgi:D-alanyl-lipoteichoic acid acyltransferase DltB (MBOAT superfamily)
MLFNSHAFIFLFLPVTFAVFFVLARTSHLLAAGWLAAASVFFYGWWNPAYVALLLASIVFNYIAGMRISQAAAGGRDTEKKWLAIAAVAANLILLGYFKYANFFVDNLNAALHTQLNMGEIILPLGISFFTFTQIAFLIDTYKGSVKEYRFVHYCLFVTYFPHLIAGPILHHAEMMPQFTRASTYRLQAGSIAVGLTIFFIGLFKKVILADGIAPYVAPLYALPAAGVAPTLVEAWCGVLAYSLQLYFDFSGYSDMAIGLSLLFGVRLPLNFHSPYKAVNIADLWNRWHMTLSRFLRDYVFVPLGGQRKSAWRRYSSVLVTMFLCGLWHGAGWTYILFGILQGIYLCVNQWWRMLRKRMGQDRKRPTRLGTLVAVLVTFVAWLVGLAIFRADSVPHALQIIAGMFGVNGMVLPDRWLPKWGALGSWLAANGVVFGDSRGLVTAGLVNWILILLAITWFAPNTQQIMARFDPALLIPRAMAPARALAWRPTVTAALLVAALAFASIVNLHRHSEFLYFQF